MYTNIFKDLTFYFNLSKFIMVTDFKNADYFISGLKQIINKQSSDNLVLQKSNEELKAKLEMIENKISEKKKENDQLKKENKLLNNNSLRLIRKVRVLEKKSRKMEYKM